MTKESVINIIKDHFSNIQEIPSKDILRAEYTPSDKPAGIFYFDFHENGIPEDLRSYQNDFLVKDYYDHPGYLQWNYYLIFLRENYEESLKLRIEENDIYTRKYIFKPEELSKFLTFSRTSLKVEKDIVVDWRKRLDEVDLNEIYGYDPVTEVRDRFLSNSVIKETEIEEPVSDDQGAPGIKNLILDRIVLDKSYRLYPVKRDFEFGAVNLISGVNGVGKTSLLEAIELVICGKTLRNPDSIEANGSIKAYYSQTVSEDTYSTTDNSKYRERDLIWYKNDYSKGNKVYESFNRYNFFCSDAAFDYQNDGSVASTLENLRKIALGSEFGRIRNRLKTLSGYLWPYQDGYTRELEEVKSQIDDANKTIQQSTNDSAEGDIFKSFIEELKKSKWKKFIPTQLTDDLTQLGKDLADSHSIIQNIKSHTQSGSFRSREDWQKESERLKALSEKGEAILRDIEELEGNKRDLQQKYDAEKNQVSVLNAALKYFNNPESFQLDGLDSLIQSTEQKLKTRQELFSTFSQLERDLLSTIKNEKLSSAKATSDQTKSDLEAKQTFAEKKIEELKGSLNQLNRIAVEIKSKGRELLKENPNQNTCPLCETHFDSATKLAEQIERQVSQLSDSIEIEGKEEELQDLKRQAKENNLLNVALIALNELTIKMFPQNNLSELSIDALLTKFGQVERELSEEDNVLNKQKELNLRLGAIGLNELDYNNTKKNLVTLFPSISLNSKSNPQFQDLLLSAQQHLSERNSQIEQQDDYIAKKRDALKSLVGSVPNVKELLKESKDKLVLCQQVLISFEKLQVFFDFQSSTDILVMDLEIGAIISRLEELRNMKIFVEQKGTAEKQIPQLEERKKELEQKIEKLEPAMKVISEITSNQDEETALSDFINTNSKKISEIFTSIHVPHEFSEIVFENQHIYLKQLNSEQRTIRKISSGQRSALVLSIFLTLNRQLENGPSILLFDDPVAFTDDLNILSFLDYLRELVINENKQLFFATANKKLAGLFEKKFSFLDDNKFKRFALSRKSLNESKPTIIATD